jgi:long-chain fatty acid transport protein
MYGFNSKRSLATFGAAALTLGPATALASGFALLEQSASRLGTAFAGTAAAADDATTIYFNAAGLTKLDRAQAIVLTSGIQITSEFRNRSSAPALLQPLGGNGGDAGGWSLVPAAYASAPIGDRLAIGIGVNAPFGLKLEYDNGWIGRFQALRSEIETLNLNPSVAYQVSNRISLGLGISYQRLDAELTNAVNYSAVVAQGVQQLVLLGQLSPTAAPAVIAANAGLEGHARVEGDDDAWGYNLGVLFDLSDQTSIGLSYRSAIEYEVRGDVGFAPPQPTNPIGGGIVAAASAAGGPLSNGNVSVDLELPDSAMVSLRHDFADKYTLFADVGWTGWSSIQELRIVRDNGAVVSVTPERWQDVWRYALGGSYRMSDQLTVRAGVAYDETPVPDETRTPRLPDADRTWVAIGARWQPSESVTLDLGYAHLFSDTVALNEDAGNVATSALLNGRQHSNVDIVSAQFVYQF